jgi:regulator of RNase E activity RraA
LAGPAVTVQANNDIISILAAVHYAQPGDVIVVTNKTDAVALIGDIIGGEAHHKGLAGFVIDGRVRDTVALLELDLTVVCRGMYPVGPLKLPDEVKDIGKRDVSLKLGEATVHPGDWVFADADGVICIAAEYLPALYEQAEQLLEREKNLIANIEKGTSLSEMVALESFLEKRAKDPTADFNAHLAEHKQTI